MPSEQMQEALNRQVQMEAQSSHAYLAMASCADIQPGLKGVTKFFFRHEIKVSQSIDQLVDISLAEKDYATHNFLQW